MARSLTPYFKIDYNPALKSWSLAHVVAAGRLSNIIGSMYPRYLDVTAHAKSLQPLMEIELTTRAKNQLLKEAK